MKTVIAIFSIIMIFATQDNFAQSKLETLTNKSVIELFKAGLSAQMIISKIESSACKFDVSTTGLISLKNQKMPDDIIAAIFKKSNDEHSAPVKNAVAQPVAVATVTPAATTTSPLAVGSELEFVNIIHYYNKSKKNLVPLERSTVAVKAKVNFLKAMVPGTAIPIVFKMDGAKSPAKVSAQENPSFMVNTGTVTPEIFGLYRMTVKKDKREATWLNISAFDNKSDKDVVAFNYRKVKEGVYEIVPVSKLDNGEYCFVNKTSYNTYGGSKADVFAFTVE